MPVVMPGVSPCLSVARSDANSPRICEQWGIDSQSRRGWRIADVGPLHGAKELFRR